MTTTDVDASGSNDIICSSEPMHVFITLPIQPQKFMHVYSYMGNNSPYVVHNQGYRKKKKFLEDIHTLISGDVLPQNKLYS